MIDRRSFLPFVPFVPIHTNCVLVTCDGLRTKPPLALIPAKTVIPPFEQMLEGAVFNIEIPTEGFGTAATPEISPERPPHEESNKFEITVQAKIEIAFLIFIKGN